MRLFKLNSHLTNNHVCYPNLQLIETRLSRARIFSE